MTHHTRRLRVALVAGTSVALTAGMLAVSAPTALANGDDRNRGTVKITNPDEDKNRKHVVCDFDVVTHRFGDTDGLLTFYAIRPSSANPPEQVGEDGPVPVGPGEVRNGPYVEGVDIDLTGLTPNDDGEYHLKVVVTPDSGKSKSKTFWLTPCPA